MALLTTVDATALEANLDSLRVSQGIINAAPDGTSNGDLAFTIKSGVGDDIIRVSDSIHSNDTVEMGDCPRYSSYRGYRAFS